MSIFNIKIAASAQVSQAVAQMQLLESSADALAGAMQRAALASTGVNPKGFIAANRALKLNSELSRAGAMSTGLWTAEQLKLNTAADDYNKKLAAQKLSLSDLRKESKTAQAAYRDQLRMQQMVVRSAGKVGGKELFDVYLPTELHKNLDTAANRFGFLREQIRSASHQMVNWGKNTQWAGRQLMVGLTMPVAAFGAAAGVMAYKIEDELIRIQKVYDTTANQAATSAKEMAAVDRELADLRADSMRTATIAAREYAVAAEDTLSVQAELAATGLRGQRLQKQTNEVMRIATLGEIDKQIATKASIALQSVFRMNTEELTDAFNYMNSVENATSLQLKDFAEAIPIASAPVKAFGGDIYELGVLLTAMRERGIEATQGANAIKAAMQRLGRPSKQIQEEWTAITGTDITKLFKDADTLTELFQKIGEATENLDNKQRLKAFAGLFGTYQVTRMTALVDGVREIDQGIGQAADAAKLAKQETTAWAEAADRELNRMIASPSKQFKAALEELKIQMANFGGPFLVIGTKIIKVINFILEKFNEMPAAIKIITGLGIAMLALAGPVIMLVGLFANLAGNAGKMFVALTRGAVSFELLNKESAAAKIASNLAERGFIQTGSAVQDLTNKLNRLAQAYEYANQKSVGNMLAPARGGAYSPFGIPTAGGATSNLPARQQSLSNVTAMTMGGPWVKNLAEVDKKSAKVMQNSKAIENSWGKTGKLMGVAGLAMAAGAVSSNETADSIANMAMTGAMAASAVSMLGLRMPKISAESAKSATLWKGISTGTKTAGSWIGKIFKVIPWIARALGPVGWTIAAISGAVALIRKGMKKAADDQKKLSNSAASWSEHLGYVREQWGSVGKHTDRVANNMRTIVEESRKLLATNPELVGGYMSQTSDEGRRLFLEQQYNVIRQTGGSKQEAIAGLQQLIIATGASLQEADDAINDFMASANRYEGLTETEKALKGVRTELELFSKDKSFWLPDTVDKNQPWYKEALDRVVADPTRFVGSFFKDSEKMAYEQGRQMALQIDNGLSELKTPWQRAEFMDKVEKDLNNEFRAIFENINKDTRINLKNAGIDVNDVKRMQELINEASTTGSSEFMEKYNLDYNDWMRLQGESIDGYKELNSLEAGILATLKQRINSESDANTLISFRIDEQNKLVGITKKQANAEYQQRLNAAQMTKAAEKQLETGSAYLDTSVKLTKEEKLHILNQERVKLGLERTARLADGFGPATRKWGQETDKVNSKLSRTQGLMAAISHALKNQNLIDPVKDAMTSFQQGIADATMNTFTSEMDAAMDQFEANAQARQAAQSKRFEAAQRRLDARQEKRRDAIENGFDKRIEKINDVMEAEEKAEELRQRIFDAEIQRLSRLAQVANTNIDFNVALNEGNLDEAAKIRNDMEAQAAEWALGDAADKGSRKSDKRREVLEERIEDIEEARDKRLKALDKVEDRELRALQNVQEKRRAALEADIANTRKAEEQKWEDRRKYTEESLDDFMAYIATSDKDLKKHVKKWENEHKELSLTTQGQFEITSDNINSYIKTSVTKAAKAMVNEADWEVNGWNIAKKMIKGAFGMTPGEFRKFIAEGILPKDYAKTPAEAPKPSNWQTKRQPGVGETVGGITRHEGGPIGVGGKNSRKGYARTSSIHPNEVPVLAEKGEFMVNKTAAAKNQALLEAINSGKDGALNKNSRPNSTRKSGTDVGIGGAGNLGMVSMFGMMMAGALRRMTENAVVNAGNNAISAASQAVGLHGEFAAGAAGKYGDLTLSASQLKHAATIANVGKSMGMSARDIQIGIMTAITESMLSLPNQAQSDRDSAGLFQQRPSQGWGTVEQVMNPEYAARKFFSVLKTIKGRGDMTPWMAAQTVQRSAYSDGSNYMKYWDEAQAIFSGLGANKTGVNYAPGKGGWHKPAPGGYGWGNTHDYQTPMGTPLYAVSDGTIVDSRAIRSGGSSDYAGYPRGYTSYGETVAMRTASGDIFRWAHLNPGTRIGLGPVKGGTMIGRSGMTGNASGPHVHMDVNGNYDALGWLRSKGIGLKSGGYTMSDGMANLHKNEVVIDPKRTKMIMEGIDAKFAGGDKTEYNITVQVANSNASPDEIAKVVMKAIKREEGRKPQSRRV